MNFKTVLLLLAAILLILGMYRMNARPLGSALRFLGSGVAGVVVLWVINVIGGPFGFHLALNPVSASLAGLLGIPGVIGLGVMKILLS